MADASDSFFNEYVENYITKTTEVMKNLNLCSITDMADSILKAYDGNSTIYIMGNGGSGASAAHIVCDFNKGASIHLEKKFRFVCLNDNMTTISAISNDCGYDKIFVMQLEGRLNPGDLVIGISGSGNSKNVVDTLEYAKSCGVKTIGLTGYNGGKMKDLVDLSVHVDVDDMQKAEDIHMMILHMVAQAISVKLGHPMC